MVREVALLAVWPETSVGRRCHVDCDYQWTL